MKKSLLDELSRRPLLGDGATGTQLQAMGLTPGACGERWNLEHPERIRELHRRYLVAGSDLLTTNSFGGTPTVLAGHGLSGQVRDINVAAAFRPQIAALLEGGADAILIETMSDPAEMEIAIRVAREAGAPVVIATYAFQKSAVGHRTMMGTTAAEAVARAIGAGADVVGANCGTELSLDDYEKLARELVAAAGRTPVIVQPNAGSPILRDGRVSYAESAAEFAAAAPRLLATGARIVGGCCGSTPEHIAAMRSALKSA